MVQQVSDFKLELMKTILDYPKGGSNYRDRRRFGSIRADAKKAWNFRHLQIQHMNGAKKAMAGTERTRHGLFIILWKAAKPKKHA